jgi:hypothetical protein
MVGNEKTEGRVGFGCAFVAAVIKLGYSRFGSIDMCAEAPLAVQYRPRCRKMR